MLQIPAPISAIQILAIDLGTDIFPSFSLGLEASEPDVMKKKPFKIKDKIIDKNGIWRLARVGLIMAVGAVVAFILSMRRGGWEFGEGIDTGSVLYLTSSTAAYAVLAMSQMANLLQARSQTPQFSRLAFSKTSLQSGDYYLGIFLSFMYVPFFQKYLHMLPITWKDWLVALVTALAVFFFEEGRKSELSLRITNKY